MVQIIARAGLFVLGACLLTKFPGVQSQGIPANIRMCQGQPLCPPQELEKPEPKTECDPKCKKLSPGHSGHRKLTV